MIEDIYEIDLLNSIELGQINAVLSILKHGVNVHYRNDEALSRAIGKNSSIMVQILLENGADALARKEGFLWQAVYMGNLEIIALMLEHGANIYACHKEIWQIPLRRNNMEILRLLLGENNVFDAGISSRGENFWGLRIGDGEIIVAVGLNFFDLPFARKYWRKNSDALARIEAIAEWSAA